MSRNQKAENLFDSALDYMACRLDSGELEKGELNSILGFLKDQGINCVADKNPKIKSMVNSLPDIQLAVNNTKG